MIFPYTPSKFALWRLKNLSLLPCSDGCVCVGVQPAMLRYVYGKMTVTGLLLLLLTTPVQFGIGWEFIRSAYKGTLLPTSTVSPNGEMLGWLGLRHGSANMALLVSLGTLAAFMVSLTEGYRSIYLMHHLLADVCQYATIEIIIQLTQTTHEKVAMGHMDFGSVGGARLTLDRIVY
jgi:cation transport ATPase